MRPYDEQHRLPTTLLDEMRGYCQVCGPVDLVPHRKKRHLVQCANGQLEEIEREAEYNKERLQDPAFRARKRELYHLRHWQRALENRYGLPKGWYEHKFEEQQGKCAICKEESLNEWGKYHVDHNHETGEARGLLCGLCNSMIGFARERPDVLESGKEYLDAYS